MMRISGSASMNLDWHESLKLCSINGGLDLKNTSKYIS